MQGDSFCAPTGGSQSTCLHGSSGVAPRTSGSSRISTRLLNANETSAPLCCPSMMDLSAAAAAAASATTTVLPSLPPLRRSPPCSDLSREKDSMSSMADDAYGGEVSTPTRSSRPSWIALDRTVSLPRRTHGHMPTTVTQRLPYAGTFEWCVPHVPQLIGASPAAAVASASPAPILSPIFVSHGQAWSLALFPRGVAAAGARCGPATHGYMSLYLTLHPPPIAATASSPSATHESRITMVAHAAPPSANNNPTPPPSASGNNTAPPPPPVIPFACAAASASGRLTVRPEVLVTLLHPSGDSRLNLALVGGGDDDLLDFASDSGAHSSSTHSVGLARLISHRALRARGFLDDAGQMLLRVELVELKRYVWSLATTSTVPATAFSTPRAPPHVAHSHSTHASRIPQPVTARQAGRHATSASVIRPPAAMATGFFSPGTNGPIYLTAHSGTGGGGGGGTTMTHTDSFVTSSHLLFGGYEFALRLRSAHLLFSTGVFRIQDLAVMLALHPRHFYRLREDLLLKVEVELALTPAHDIDAAATNARSTTTVYRTAALLHATAPEIEWPHAASTLEPLLRARDDASLVSFSHLHVSVVFHSLGVVWSLGGFSSLGSGRRTSGMFRLRDLTWSLIVDPRGNGEPGFLSVYLALDKTSAGVFCHGLALAPVFTLAVLHPTDPSNHLVRRFEDALFTFERASWGCTCFVELALLKSGGWLGVDGLAPLQIEVQVQSARIVRPEELAVHTKIGPERNNIETSATSAAAAADQWDEMSCVSVTEEEQVARGVSGVGGIKKLLYITPSSPALVAQNASVSPPLPPPLSGLSSSSSSRAHRRVGSAGYRSTSSSSSGGSSGRGGSPSSVSSAAPLHSSSFSPPLTPMLEYLGAEIDEESDSYALAAQARRFGGRAVDGGGGWSGLEAMRLRTGDGRSNSAFMLAGAPSASSATAPPVSPPPLTLPPPMHPIGGAGGRPGSCPTTPCSDHTPFLSHPLTSTTRHGYVCVIRNSQFTDPKLPQLIGYEVDEDRLMNTFLHALHCDLETHLNIPGAEMTRVLKALSQKDYTSYDHLTVFILTHGVDSNTVYAADGAHVAVNDIFCMFRGDECRSLAGKPKLFFVQACRGNCVDYSAREGSGIPNLNPPVTATATTATPSPAAPTTSPAPTTPAPTSTPSTPPVVNLPIVISRSPSCGSLPLGHHDIPNESDFLYASSCVPGYISWTNTASGSWYITALCNVLLSYWPTMHLGDILLRVNYAVSKQNKLVDKYGSVYQIAAPAFTLTRKMYFVRQRHTLAASRLPTAIGLQDEETIPAASAPTSTLAPRHDGGTGSAHRFAPTRAFTPLQLRSRSRTRTRTRTSWP